MKTTFLKFAAATLAAVTLTINANAANPSSSFVGVCTTRNSPNRLPVGQCTWFADIACAEAGRTLSFSRNWGRDAALWPWLVTSARACLVGPAPNSLVVFGPLNTPGGAGHVAWIESTARDGSFTVLHVNYGGAAVGYLNNVPVVRTTFRPVPGGLVQAVGGTTKLQVTAFILL